VHADDRDEIKRAEQILKDGGATDIKVGAEKNVPKVETRVDRSRDRV